MLSFLTTAVTHRDQLANLTVEIRRLKLIFPKIPSARQAVGTDRLCKLNSAKGLLLTDRYTTHRRGNRSKSLFVPLRTVRDVLDAEGNRLFYVDQ